MSVNIIQSTKKSFNSFLDLFYGKTYLDGGTILHKVKLIKILSNFTDFKKVNMRMNIPT